MRQRQEDHWGNIKLMFREKLCLKGIGGNDREHLILHRHAHTHTHKYTKITKNNQCIKTVVGPTRLLNV